MSPKARYLEEDLLWAVAHLVDEEVRDLTTGSPASPHQVFSALLDGDPKAYAKVAQLAVARGTSAAGLTDLHDLESRKEEIRAVVEAWLDGFLIATRYAQDTQKRANAPRPERKIL